MQPQKIKKHEECNCFSRRLVHNIVHDEDHAFMGYTHALSGLAATTLLFGIIGTFFMPLNDLLNNMLGTTALAVVMLFILSAIGAVMVPDLDNTSSRARNDLGLFGVAISGLFRGSSIIIQNTIRTRRDPIEPNPHRGFYHTLPGAILIAGIVFALTRIEKTITLSFISSKPEVSVGWLAGMIAVFILTHLALSTLAKEYMDKIRKSAIVGEAIALLVSLGVSLALLYLVPKDLNFWWLSLSIFFGMTVHVLGDTFTRAGAPIAFPIPIRGKMWWNVRFAMIKAGSDFEKIVIVRIFTVLAVIGIILMIVAFTKV